MFIDPCTAKHLTLHQNGVVPADQTSNIIVFVGKLQYINYLWKELCTDNSLRNSPYQQRLPI